MVKIGQKMVNVVFECPLAGFTAAGFLIIESITDWENHQTITTLKSIATPIQEVQFPTVTVCPHEDTPPDNWSFLEKLFNAFAFDGTTSLSEKVRSDIVNKIAAK